MYLSFLELLFKIQYGGNFMWNFISLEAMMLYIKHPYFTR